MCTVLIHVHKLLSEKLDENFQNTTNESYESCYGSGSSFTRMIWLFAVPAPQHPSGSERPLVAGLLTGGPARREAIAKNWFFNCGCPRCQDGSDLGTYFDRLKNQITNS
jgi:hypothetical protein